MRKISRTQLNVRGKNLAPDHREGRPAQEAGRRLVSGLGVHSVGRFLSNRLPIGRGVKRLPECSLLERR